VSYVSGIEVTSLFRWLQELYMDLDLDSFEARPSGLLVPPMLANQIMGRGVYTGQIIRKGIIIDEFEYSNLVVNQGLNYLLGSALAGGSQITTWYIGLFSGNYTVLSTDTASSIASNSTEVTAYAAGARQAWVANSTTPSGESTSNSSSQASFTFNGSVTLYGGFLVSTATISGTGGTLFSGAQFGASKAVVSGDILLLTYTFTAASA
jgi:hypothetical protein